MVVGKVSEFIGSLYYLCVTLLRFKNIKSNNMKRKTWIKLVYILFDSILAFGFGMFTFRYSGVVGFSAFTEVQKISIFIYSGSIALLHIAAFIIFKVYNILSANFSIADALKVGIISFAIHVIGLITIIAVPNQYLFFQWQELLSWAIAAVIVAILMIAERFAPRLLILLQKTRGSKKTIRTLVIGAGAASKIVVEDSKYNKDNNHNIVVLVDDDTNKIGVIFSGIPV